MKISIRKRRELEAQIEDLIGLLDLMDGDCDLEPYLAGTDGDDREGDDCDAEEDDPGEPAGDELDFSWPEGSLGFNLMRQGSIHEDDEANRQPARLWV